MLYTKKFVFTVSLCAMLAVNPVLATAPTNDEELGTAHEVYVESTLNQATNGIAGVSYVNRMVNAAGNAATAAEGHAAAAGAHALSAAQSADEAHKVLADKVSIDQGADNKNKVMVTDDEGSVYAGYVDTDMIADGAVTADKIAPAAGGISGILLTEPDGVSWGKISDKLIADGAVTTDKISGYAITTDKIADGAVTKDKIAADSVILVGQVLLTKSGASGMYPDWGQIITEGIANGAVTADKIADGAVTRDKISGDAVTADKIADGAVTTDKIKGSDFYTGFLASHGSKTKWRQVGTADIADSAVTTDKIVTGAVTADKIGADTSGISVGSDKQSFLYAYETGDGSVIMNWGQIRSAGIANGAVTIDKTAGVVGMVPVGGEGATTYGSFWIE